MSTLYTKRLRRVLPCVFASLRKEIFRLVGEKLNKITFHQLKRPIFRRLILLPALWMMSIGFTKAQCSINLTPTVSGCYSVSGVSKATVSVEVDWSKAPANDYIIVTTGAQSRTIVPGVSTITYPQPTTVVITGSQNIVTPQVVAFELTLSGAASVSTITAKFASNTSCQVSQTYNLPAACPPTSCTGTQLGGTVFRDFNADGIQQASETQGVASVTVTAFDCNGTKYGPVVTDQFGKYVFTAATITYPVRVEFRTAAGNDMGTVYGSSSHSNVQFVDQATCSVDLGIANPYLYCQSDPKVFIPCYTYGDPLNLNPTPPVTATALSANAAAVVSFPYDESTTAATGMTHWADAGQLGTVWGLGYNRVTKDIFMAATLHRHSGLGPLGLGGIYVTHTGSSTLTEGFIDVTTLGVDVGAASVPENGSTGRGLSADLTKPSHDPDVFQLIGKVGIGGLEVDETGQKIWFVNLYDKQLYSIDISAYNTSGTLPTGADVKSYPIPDPGCTGGGARPWALHVYNGKLYVGTVCDAIDSQNKSNLRAYVYAFDPTTSLFASVFDFPLTYPKGYGISPLNSAGQAGADSTGWYPWTDTFSDLVIPTSTAAYISLIHPQPILADIDFDVDGSMVLGFADRTGFQGGYNNYSTDPSETQLYTVNPAAGDILRAYYSNGSYILENNGKVGPYVGVGVNNKQGPGFGEFYDDNYISGNRYTHTELVLGGLALRLGSGHVVGTTIDPVANVANSGGVKYWNNETGVAEAAAIVYATSTAPGTFAKASGLGEPELNCDLLQVIEIGNRVWVDTNKDGIQDPCEKSLANVQVDLYKGTTKIASTTTSADGEYYFSSKAALTNGTWLGTNADTTLLPNTAYSLVFGASRFSNNVLTINGSILQLTVANSTTTNASDLNDSDALVATVAGVTAPVISLTTGNAGYINHNLDAGFSCLPTAVASISVTGATCNGGSANNNGMISVTGIQYADKVFLVASNSALPSYTATGSQPVSASAVSFTGLSNPVSTSGQSYSVVFYNGPCCYTVLTTTLPYTSCCSLSATATPTACNSVTNEYTVNGTISLAGNTSGGVATITNSAVSTTVNIAPNATSASYSLTGLISNGASYTVMVSLSSCGTAIATYSAPASCTVAPPALVVVMSSPVCNSVTNQYTATGTVSMSNVVGGTLAITDNGSSLTTIALTNGQTTASFSVSGISNASSHTVVVILSGGPSASTLYTAPVACTVCSTSITTASLPNAQVGTAYSQSITASGGATPYTYSVVSSLPAGLSLSASGVISGTPTASGTTSFTINVSDAKSCSDTQPMTITVDALPVCSLTATATPGQCNTATNQYSVTGTVAATNATGTQSLTIAVGNINTVVSLSGNGPVSYTLNGLNSDGTIHAVSVLSSAIACGSASVTYAAPASCTVALAGLGDFVWLDSDKDGVQDSSEPGIAGVTAILYVNGVASATTVTDASGFYSFTGLTPGNSTSYIVGFTAPMGYTATTPYSGTDRTVDSNADLSTGKTESVTLAPSEFNPTLDAGYYALPTLLTLDKVVDKSKAKQGDILTYTLVLTNVGSTTATNVTVRDSTTTGLSYVTNSASAPAGTTFTYGNPISTWTVATLTPGQSLSLTFQAKADSTGILYNVATIPGDTAKVCTSIPVKVCQGSGYQFELSVAPGHTNYKWYRDGVEIVGATTNVLSVTAAGTYSLVVDGGSGQCSDFSCCPFIIEEDTLPTFKAVAVPATCVGNVAQTNGQLVLSKFNAGYTYQYSLGSSFNAAASLSGAAQVIPANGIIAAKLANPAVGQSYTIRVYNSNGCYTDVTVLLMPTVCGCPASICVPMVIRQTKGPVRGH